MVLADTDLTTGDLFMLAYYLHNPEMDSYTADVWILLEVNDHYWCYPSWISLETAVDFSAGIEVLSGASYYEEVLNFEWPDASGGIECIFYGAAFEPGTFDFIGDLQVIHWSY